MDIITVLIIAVALSMDAFSVSITNGLYYKNFNRKKQVLSSFLFGFFQGAMPIIGFFIGNTFSENVGKFSPLIAFALLFILGGKMVFDYIKEIKDNEEDSVARDYKFKVVLIQAIATSIDALAVGVTFAVVKDDIWISSSIIAIVTFVICLFGCFIGNKIGNKVGKTSVLIGGLILIAIALKFLVEFFI